MKKGNSNATLFCVSSAIEAARSNGEECILEHHLAVPACTLTTSCQNPITYTGLSPSLTTEDPTPSIPPTLGVPEPTRAPPCNPSQWTRAGKTRFRAYLLLWEVLGPRMPITGHPANTPVGAPGAPSPSLFPGPAVASCSGKAVARRPRDDDWTGGAQGSREPRWPP